MKTTRAPISVAGRTVRPADRYRYEDMGEGQSYRFRAHPARPATRADDVSFCTNGKGAGLFAWDRSGIHQLLGTTQFKASTLDQFRRSLRRFLSY